MFTGALAILSSSVFISDRFVFFCLGTVIFLFSWIWLSASQNVLKRATMVLWLSLTLVAVRLFWALLPEGWFLFIPLVSGAAFLSFLFLSRFLESIVQLVWAFSLPARVQVPQVAIWQMLLHTRVPLTAGRIWRDLIAKLRQDGSAEAGRLLAEAVSRHPDPEARRLALQALETFTNTAGIDAVCGVWAAARHPDLAELITRKEWRASAPPKTLVLCALLIDQVNFLRKGKTDWIEPLAQAALDADPLIAERACQVLRELETVKAQETLCRLAIRQGNAPALAAALSAGYLPRGGQERALFLFMTEQWERYASHDFDRQLMRMAYVTAPEPLQQRIREKLRNLGRIDFLPIIAGDGTAHVNAGENEVLVQTLIANRNWEDLWQRAFDLTFQWSVRAIEALVQSGWQPAAGEDQALLAELAALVADGLVMEPADVQKLFPPALLQATARVPGRINAVGFAPVHPSLAIGTGQGKVVLWNYQTAQRERVLRNFAHSVGEVAFSAEGTLLCAERTNGTAPCSIYTFADVWQNDTSFNLGTHTGSITALAPLSRARALSAGSDRHVILWDIAAGREIHRRALNDWARNLRVSPDETQLLLMRRGLDLLSLPELEPTARMGNATSFRCAAFAPNGQSMFIGTSSGKVFVCQKSPNRKNLLVAGKEPVTLYSSSERVEAIEVLKQAAALVSAGTGGEIRFFSIDGYTSLGTLTVPGGQVTSLHISPDEAFLAVGSAEAKLTLWDLRSLNVRLLLERPFAQAEITILPSLNALAAHTDLPPLARQALRFAQVVLRHRFRYTIELAEPPSIALGEFDIELE